MIVFCCIYTQFVTLCIIIAFSLTEIGHFLVPNRRQHHPVTTNYHTEPLDVHPKVQNGRS